MERVTEWKGERRNEARLPAGHTNQLRTCVGIDVEVHVLEDPTFGPCDPRRRRCGRSKKCRGHAGFPEAFHTCLLLPPGSYEVCFHDGGLEIVRAHHDIAVASDCNFCTITQRQSSGGADDDEGQVRKFHPRVDTSGGRLRRCANTTARTVHHSL